LYRKSTSRGQQVLFGGRIVVDIPTARLPDREFIEGDSSVGFHRSHHPVCRLEAVDESEKVWFFRIARLTVNSFCVDYDATF
jgi:hypothetical protein